MGAQNIYRRKSYLDRIAPFIDTEPVKVLTGMRRSGKSTIMHMLIDELVSRGRSRKDIFFLDLESRDGRDIRTEDQLYEHITTWAEGRSKVYVMLDEIQNLDGWERCIRSLLVDLDADIYLTGSSSKMLSGELATHLAGRYVEFRIQPFSFKEVTEVDRMMGTNRDKDTLFQLYLRYGGMPLIVTTGYDELRIGSIMKAMYDSVVINDICERNRIRDSLSLKEVLRYTMSEIGHPMSSSNISNHIRSQGRSSTPDTVLSHLAAAEDAMFISKARRQDIRGREVLKTDYKFYLMDLGFREIDGFENISSIDQSLENIVYNELVSRGYTVTIGKGRNSEVDFIADKGTIREYYQVTYLLASESTVEREFGALEDVSDSYPKYVLSMDRLDMSRNGIIHRNIVEWLLRVHDQDY